MWVRLKGERRRADLVDYYVEHESPLMPNRMVGVTHRVLAVLDHGTTDEMNARFDDMERYQDASARYKSGAVWCYDMGVPVGEAQRKVSKDGVSQG